MKIYLIEMLSNNDTYRAASRIQRRFREKRTLKRNRAASRIQSRARGKLTRKKHDVLHNYK